MLKQLKSLDVEGKQPREIFFDSITKKGGPTACRSKSELPRNVKQIRNARQGSASSQHLVKAKQDHLLEAMNAAKKKTDISRK